MCDVICLGCKRSCKSLAHHLGKRPDCKRKYAALEQKEEEPAAKLARIFNRSDIVNGNLHSRVVDDLALLRWGKMIGPGNVDSIKAMFSSWMEVAVPYLAADLKSVIPSASGLDVDHLLRSRLSFFEGIETTKQEEKAFRQHLGTAYVTPVKRFLGSHQASVKGSDGVDHSSMTISDYCWDLPLVEQLNALIQHEPERWREIQEASARWSEIRESEHFPIEDVEHGTFFLDHEMLGAKSGPLFDSSSKPVTKLAFKGYFDEIESCNALGFAAGKHKLGCFYVSIVNLPPNVRNRLAYTFVVSICLNSDIKRYGMPMIFGGVDGAYNPLPGHETAFGSQLRLLDKGIHVHAPDV